MNSYLQRHHRLLAAVTIFFTLLVGVSTTQASQQWPELASPISEPAADPFYASPDASTLQATSPGTVLRFRAMDAKALLVFPQGGTAWQLMYRSTDHKGKPVANVTAVLIPTNAPKQGRKAFAYNIAYDARTLKCAPSYQIAKGTTWEQPWFNAGLSKGWVAIVPDYEGLNSYWALGKYNGPAVLDAIRAAESFGPAGLNRASTPVAITGYSGGAVAATWANEFYREYAPELNIKGVIAGGVAVDTANVARAVDGTSFAGLYMGVVAGLRQAYPEYNIESLFTDAGKAMLKDVDGMCAGQFLAGVPDVIGAYSGKKMSSYTTVPDLLEAPQIKPLLTAGRLGQIKPGAPTYLYNGIFDQVMPVKDVRALAKSYCNMGVKVEYKEHLGDHILSMVLGTDEAFKYMEDRLNGKTAPSACWWLKY